MMQNPLKVTRYDDPLRLRELLGRARELAERHALCSVLVGLAGYEGDRIFPEVVDYVESALRVDDSVFRMTRERAVLLLADVNRTRAAEIMERLLEEFGERFPAAREPAVCLGYYEVSPGEADIAVRDVLPAIFAGSPQAH